MILAAAHLRMMWQGLTIGLHVRGKQHHEIGLIPCNCRMHLNGDPALSRTHIVGLRSPLLESRRPPLTQAPSTLIPSVNSSLPRLSFFIESNPV